jgi:hypothetical protein
VVARRRRRRHGRRDGGHRLRAKTLTNG